MVQKSGATVHWRDIARGLVAGLPDTLTTLRGVGTLLKVRLGAALSVGAVLEANAEAHAKAAALLFENQRWTYAELNLWVNRLAHTLRREGVRAGDVVALLMENHAATLACVAAVAKLGAIAGMLNPNLRGDALRHSVRAMSPARLIVAGECLDGFAELGATWTGPVPLWLRGYGDGTCPAGWTDLAAASERASTRNPQVTARIDLASPFCYILTSGTTGMPKASVMSHRRWLRSMAGMGQLTLRLKPGDVLYCALPLYHNNALTVSWSATMATGAALALDRKFSASRFWARVRHFDAVAFSYIGELCRYLLAQPPLPDDRQHRVRACIGNGLRPEIWRAFKDRFAIERICEFYGASEGNMVFVNSFNVDETAGYCPFPFAVAEYDPATALPRRNAEGRLDKVARGGVGLLLTEVTDSAPFDGYTDSGAGEKKLVRDAFKAGDCWFNTGDLVRDQGWRHIQFVDRLGDTFRWKGENVATTEVEAALGTAPGIADCTVYGVQVPHMDGRAGMAAFCLADTEALDGAALAAHLCAQLPAYAVPVFLRRVVALETTATFKTRKQLLRDEGCDPTRVADPLYVLLDRARGYERLTPETWKTLQDGRQKL
ncbi:MAG TPA: long-chain-acyl-CoA synthetase [Verrucomicrobiae bacterium]|nr:long-chain-acyl-CoA synthetase [Verrucomicrobiae bacterium]